MIMSNKLLNIKWLHKNFFQYKQFFLYNKYSLVGMPLSNLQLTYMDNIWENIEIPTYYNSNSTYKCMYKSQFKKHLHKFKLLPIHLLLILKKYTYSLQTSKVNSRRISQSILPYYIFLNKYHTKKSKNYIQYFIIWLIEFKKQYQVKQGSVLLSQIRYKRRSIIQDLYTKLNYSPKSFLTKNNLMTLQIKNNLSITSLNLKILPQISLYKYKQRNWSLRYKSPWFTKTLKIHNSLFLQHKVLPLKLKDSLKQKNILYSKFTPSYSFFSYKKVSNIEFKPDRLQTFILKNYGLFIISKFKWLKTKDVTKSQLKKKLFSFIFPGQLKKNLLIRRKKIILTRLLQHTVQNITVSQKFIYKNFYKIFHLSFFLNRKNILSNSINNNFHNNLEKIYYNFDFYTKGSDIGDMYVLNEVRIPRVRFKPGYQRIWRQVRSAVKLSLNVKFQYQHQLTKYLTKFYHLSNQYLLSYSESTLDKILIFSHLLPDMSTVILFQQNGFIFLNGNVTTNLKSILIKNDFIQLIVSLWYYIITRWFLNWTNLRVRKFKRMVYRKNKPLQYKIMKNKKQQSYHTPNWIYQTRYDNNDIKPYLESDFFTLSVFLLTDTYVHYFHKVDDMVDLRNSTYMLYNWKYIT